MRAEQLNSTLVNRNSFYKIQSYNQGASKNSPIVRDADGNKRRDVAAISPMQRAGSMIEALQKQKQSILEAKKELVAVNNRAGKDMDAIKTQLDSYNELLNSLDEQITKVMTDLAVEEANKLDELKEKMEEKASEASAGDLPKTEDEVFAERMGDLAQADADLDKAEHLSSLKRMASNKVAIAESEIALDESLMSGTPAVGKRSELQRLNQYISSLDKDITRAVKDVNGSIDKSQEDKETIKDTDRDGIEDTPTLDGMAPPEEDKEEAAAEEAK